MLEDSELETNVLEFSEKSFSFARAFDFDGSELLRFHRTETESESRFRPRLIRLYLVLPRSWIVSDLASERLSIRPPGASGPRPAGRT
ncbi:MAG TPA: hypothetical protein VGV64_01465, partial [Thermoplasmata archaeon]|nr:hypothetical protein [Thermoplasmata archaeon]